MSPGSLTKSGSESSISEACETSAKESAQRHDEKDTCSDNEEPTFSQNDVIAQNDDVIAQNDDVIAQNDDAIESCDEAKTECDNEKDFDTEKDDHKHSKLQKQGNVVLRRKSKTNPLYRKSKLFCNYRRYILYMNIFFSLIKRIRLL